MTYEVVINCPDMDDASDVLERAIYIFDSHLVQMRNVGSGNDGKRDANSDKHAT